MIPMTKPRVAYAKALHPATYRLFTSWRRTRYGGALDQLQRHLQTGYCKSDKAAASAASMLAIYRAGMCDYEKAHDAVVRTIVIHDLLPKV